MKKHYYLKLKSFILLFSLILIYQTSNAQSTEYDWTEKIQLYGHGFSVPTDFTEVEFEYIANTFKVFTVEKRHAYVSYGGSPSTERSTIGTAEKLRDINPDIKVLLYWNAVMNYETLYESNTEFGEHPEWVHSIWPSGYEIYDLENLDCQDWWVNSIVKIIEDGDLDGVFLDAGPKADVSGLTEALVTSINRVRAQIGNDKIVVYNGYRVVNTNVQAGPELSDYTSGVFIEFFLHAPLDTKEEAALLFDNLTDAYNDGKVILPRGTPSSYLPGVEEQDQFHFSFASFLLFYGPNTYWIYNDGYNKTEGMFDYYPEYYDIATGASLSGPQRDGWVYTREFENYTITVDLENLTSSIEAKTMATTGVSVDPSSVILTSIGATQSLSATVSPASAVNKNVTWSSSNITVASVNSSGLVTAHSEGAATITVTTDEGGFTDTSNITVYLSGCGTFSQIEGENYDSMLGVDIRNSLDTNGGQIVGQIHNGDWCMYSNLNLTCATSVDARVASFQVGGDIEVRIDGLTGTLIGTISQGTTGGWQDWVTATATITSPVSGIHDVYLIFTGGSAALFNFNWFKFNNGALSVNELNGSVNKSFKIYPNPATYELNIELNNSAASNRISVFNSIGQMVILDEFINKTHTIDISKLPIGIYAIKIKDKDNEQVLTKKFIKQ